MSWLSSNLTGGLSNITGQISNFTREMLTEGTEEVADVSAELKVARERIHELEAIISVQKSEYESVKSQNAELHDRVEAAEMQIQKMKYDYRSQIETKEKELIEMREQLQEKEHWQYDTGFERRGIRGSVGDDDDTEIHRLQRELVKLQRENSQLKKGNLDDQESEKLHKQVDEYQHELATLQASHSQKIASLTRKYKNDMQLWQKEKEDLLNNIEELEKNLQDYQRHGDEKIPMLNQSSDENEELREALEEANSQIKTLQDRISTKEEKILELISSSQETESLREALDNANRQIKSLQDNICTNEDNKMELNSNSLETESLREALREANIQIKTLQDRISSEEKKIIELIKSKQETVSLREALQEANSEIKTLQNRISVNEEKLIELTTISQETELLRKKLEAANTQIKTLQDDINTKDAETEELKTSSVKTGLTSEALEEAKSQVRMLKDDISTKEAQMEELKITCQENESLREALQEAKSQVRILKDDISTKEAQMEELKITCQENESLREALQEANSQIEVVRGNLRTKEEKIAELMEEVCEVASLKEEIDNLKDESQQSNVSKLEEDVSSLRQEKKKLESELRKCSVSEQEKFCSLQQVKEEIGLLTTATEELMEELEMSQSLQKDQKVEIESLKKICTIKGDVTEEVVRLRDALTALWERHVIVMGQYEKVRIELHSSNQRLLAQIQASHSHVRELRLGFSVTHNKILDSNMDKLDQMDHEKQTLIQKSSEVRQKVEEQESAVIDLHSDNEQVLQEIKLCVAEMGCQASLEDESADLVSALQAEKALLEKTIVGLEHKVQDLEEEVQALRGMGPSEHEMESENESLGSRDIVYQSKRPTNDSENHDQSDYVDASEMRVNDAEERFKKQNLMISSLQEELEEYRRFTEVYEEDKEALETAVVESRKLLKQSEKQNQIVMAERERLLQSFRDLDREFGNKLNTEWEDKVFSFENEVEKFELFSTQFRKWMAQSEAEKATNLTDQGTTWSTVSLDESNTNLSSDKDSESFRQIIAELELDNSVLREQTEKLIYDLNSKTASLTTLQGELEKKCLELEDVQKEKVNLVVKLSENEQSLRDLQETFESERFELTVSRDESITTLQAEQQDMLNVLKEKQREADSLKGDNHQLMSLLQDKQQENDDLLNKTVSLTSLISESEKMLEELKSENEMILSQLDENKELGKIMTRENSSLLEENNKLNQSLKELQRRLDFHEKEIAKQSSLNFELEDLKVKLQDAGKEKKSFEENLNILNMAKASIQNSLESRNKELDTLKTLHSEKATEVKLLKSQQDRLNEVIAAENGKVKELEQRLNVSVSEKEELLQNLHEKDVEIGQLQLDVREKGTQNDFLRLDLAKVNKTLKEKEKVLHLSSTSDRGGPENMEQKLRALMKLIEEKDYEMEALKQKDASLLELVTESEKSGIEVREHYEEQIQQLKLDRERALAELAHKDEELLTVNDRLEAMKEKMTSKDQASTMLHAEYTKLVSLNQSQGNDIAKLREKNNTLLKLLEEKEKVKRNEDVGRIQDENHRLNLQMNALHSEQERLLNVIHDKDKQIKNLVQASEPQIRASNPLQELLAERRVKISNGFSLSEDDIQQKDDEISSLRNELSRIREFLNEKQKMILKLTENNDNLVEQNDNLCLEISSLKKNHLSVDDSKIASLEEKLQNSSRLISEKDKEMLDTRKNFDEQRHELLQQLEAVRTESKEVEHLKDKEISELKNKVIHLFSSMKFVDSGFQEVTCDLSTSASIELSFQALIQTFRNLWSSLVREKDYEISCLKEKVTNLSILSDSNEIPGNFHLENALKEKEELSRQLLKTRKEVEEILSKKELAESNFQEQLISLSQSFSEKEKELLVLREKLKTEKIEFERLKQEKESLGTISEEKEVEIEHLRTKVQQLGILEADHRENISKLNKLVEDYKQVVDEREKKIDQLVGEKSQNENLTQRVVSLEKQLSVACKDKKSAEDKLNSELERLRSHLIMVEESYTREALLAEERERDLGERLERAEKQLISSSSSLKDTNRQATQQRESLQEQLHVIASQRDEAIMQLSNAQEQTQQYTVALQNLQMVLEQFQREKDDQLSLAKEQAQKEIEKARSETLHMQQREADLRNQLAGAARVLQDVGALKQQIADKDEEIAKWKFEVDKKEEEVQLSQQKIKDLRTNNDSKVDKVLVKNLLLGYFHTPEAKRSDAVHVIGGLLDFTPDEFAQVGSGTGGGGGAGGGWISSLLPFGGAPRTPTHKQSTVGTPTKPTPVDKSFSELFVSFLEHESESSALATSSRGPAKNLNPLLHGISPHQVPLNQAQTTSATPNERSNPLGQLPPSLPGSRPPQMNPGNGQPGPPTAVASVSSNILVNNPGSFTSPQNSRSNNLPLLVRPGQDLSSHDSTVSPLRTLIGKS